MEASNNTQNRARQNSFNNPSSSPLIQTFKVVIIGEKNVGKTSIVQRYTEDKFSESNDMTLGAQFSTKIVDLFIPNSLLGKRNTTNLPTVENPSFIGKKNMD